MFDIQLKITGLKLKPVTQHLDLPKLIKQMPIEVKVSHNFSITGEKVAELLKENGAMHFGRKFKVHAPGESTLCSELTQGGFFKITPRKQLKTLYINCQVAINDNDFPLYTQVILPATVYFRHEDGTIPDGIPNIKEGERIYNKRLSDKPKGGPFLTFDDIRDSSFSFDENVYPVKKSRTVYPSGESSCDVEYRTTIAADVGVYTSGERYVTVYVDKNLKVTEAVFGLPDDVKEKQAELKKQEEKLEALHWDSFVNKERKADDVMLHVANWLYVAFHRKKNDFLRKIDEPFDQAINALEKSLIIKNLFAQIDGEVYRVVRPTKMGDIYFSKSLLTDDRAKRTSHVDVEKWHGNLSKDELKDLGFKDFDEYFKENNNED